MIEKMIEETYSLIQEPIYFTLKYDGTTFRLEVPLGIEESSVINCTAREYFNLEESIASVLLYYVKAKTEIKKCQDA